MNYKQQSIQRRLPTCQYTLSEVDDLIQLCLKIHQECHARFKDDIQTKSFFVAGLDINDFAKIDEFVALNFQWTLEIYGSNGEYLNITDMTSIKKVDIPYRIQKIRIRNDFLYEFRINAKPSSYFDALIDFSEQKVFDLISHPTPSTKNESNFLVSSINGVTAKGFAAEFDAFFKKHSNLNYFVNRENVYDLVLWVFFLPLFLLYLCRYSEVLVPQRLIASPEPIQLIFAIILFFQILLCFRLIFNFLRWFFPCQELTTQTSFWRRIAKYVFSTILAGILGAVAYNLISQVFIKLVN